MDSSDEETLHIDTDAKPEVKSRNSKVKKKSSSAAGILDLLQASKQVGGIDYSNNRSFYLDCVSFELLIFKRKNDALLIYFESQTKRNQAFL